VIRVLIAAPSAVMRAGLESLFASSPGISLVGSYADLAAVDELRPDVVLANVPLDELAPAHAIVLLADDPQAAWSQEALRTGVRAVLPSSASPAEILAAVEAAAAGLAAIDPQELEALLAGSGRPHPGGTQALTPREVEVLRMMAEGAANKTIAWKLAISEHTVKFHVASIMSKLNAASRTEAVMTGIRQGLVLI
jgi:DNA-binding NarL/FixJ family response regulator